MIDMCQKFHRSNVTCLKDCHDQLCQMLKTGQALLIEISVFCQDLKGYHLPFLEVMSLYYGEASKWIEIYIKYWYDLSNA